MDQFYEFDKANEPLSRVFLGTDGNTYITDKMGIRRATALALALLALRPTQRISGYREADHE